MTTTELLNNAKFNALNAKKVSQLEGILTQIKSLQAKEKEIRQALTEQMEKYGLTEEPIKLGNLTLSYKKGYERTTLDSKLIKEEYPLVYNAAKKVSKVSPTTLIKLNQED